MRKNKPEVYLLHSVKLAAKGVIIAQNCEQDPNRLIAKK